MQMDTHLQLKHPAVFDFGALRMGVWKHAAALDVWSCGRWQHMNRSLTYPKRQQWPGDMAAASESSRPYLDCA